MSFYAGAPARASFPPHVAGRGGGAGRNGEGGGEIRGGGGGGLNE